MANWQWMPNCCCDCKQCPCQCATYRLHVSAGAVSCATCGTCNCGGFEQCLDCCGPMNSDFLLGTQRLLDNSTASCQYAGGYGGVSYTLSYCDATGVWTLTGTSAANWQASPNVIWPPGCRLTNACSISFVLTSPAGLTCDGNITFDTVKSSSAQCNGQTVSVSVDPSKFSAFQNCCTGSVCDLPDITLTLSAMGTPCVQGQAGLCACCDCGEAVGGTYSFGQGNTSVTVPANLQQDGHPWTCCGCSCFPAPIYLPPGCTTSCWFVVGLILMPYCTVNDDATTTWGYGVDVFLLSCMNWCQEAQNNSFIYCGESSAVGGKIPCDGSHGSIPLGPPKYISCPCTVCCITGGSIDY